MKIPFSLGVILLFPLLVDAYTWQFTSPPNQCNNVTLSIQGSGGQPPYSLLILPAGPSPLPNNIEVRSIQNIPFSGTSTSLSFNLNYPANSSFVAVVSDKSGFGTGGASAPVTVLQSPDSSCYSSSNPVHYAWYYVAPGGLTQCESVRLSWEAPLVNGTVNFYGIIPGGTSFAVPQGPLSTNDTGTGFDWVVNIKGGTDVLLIGNDDGGIGTGGSAGFTVGYSEDNSCLNSNSPSSTAGNPAGGSYYPTSTSASSSTASGSGSHPTSTAGSSNNGGGGHHSNTGAIIGGAAGGAVGAVILLGLVVFRRRLRSAFRRLRPVNRGEERREDHGLPQYSVPERNLVPDSSSTRAMSEVPSTRSASLVIA